MNIVNTSENDLNRGLLYLISMHNHILHSEGGGGGSCCIFGKAVASHFADPDPGLLEDSSTLQSTQLKTASASACHTMVPACDDADLRTRHTPGNWNNFIMTKINTGVTLISEYKIKSESIRENTCLHLIGTIWVSLYKLPVPVTYLKLSVEYRRG
jgi:hypothetical protein